MSQRKVAPLASFKAVNPAAGIFEAVVSVFGNVDTVGDRVLPPERAATPEAPGRQLPGLCAAATPNQMRATVEPLPSFP